MTATQTRDQVNTRVYAARQAFIAASHIPALPQPADPGDAQSPTARRYQAEGLAALDQSLADNGPISPVPYITDAAPDLTDDQVRLLRQADRGDLYLGRETGVWFRRSELGRFLVKVRPADAAELQRRGLVTATRAVARTRWLAGELTDAGRAALTAAELLAA